MAAVSSLSSAPFLLLFLTVTVEMRPWPKGHDAQVSSVSLLSLQVLHSLFGSRLSSLILASPTSDDIREGSVARPDNSSSSSFPRKGLAASHGAARGLAERQGVVPPFFLDFLQGQSKMRRRGRTSVVGGRGCFGMKMDRIGAISGLGC
uniref:C-type natriuretic peptide 2 n=1 Tax=Mola mola TaxID=94237 RepID=A0A3Q4B8X6_MOLML